MVLYTIQDKKINDFEDNPTQDYLWRLIKEDDEKIVAKLEAEKKAKKAKRVAAIKFYLELFVAVMGALAILKGCIL